jgi:hypothetical protein
VITVPLLKWRAPLGHNLRSSYISVRVGVRVRDRMKMKIRIGTVVKGSGCTVRVGGWG